MVILSVSDIVIPFLYSQQIRKKFSYVDIVIACGDLPYYYQEYIQSMLDVPLFFVRGNHDPLLEKGNGVQRSYPMGGFNLHRRIVCQDGLTLAGVEGCLRYKRQGGFQYTQKEMWNHVLSLAPGLLFNRIRYGRYLDIFVTHAPPWGIHDKMDWPHRGIKAFRWLLQVFKPTYHFHGHIHVYRPDVPTKTRYKDTTVINTYGYQTTKMMTLLD